MLPLRSIRACAFLLGVFALACPGVGHAAEILLLHSAKAPTQWTGSLGQGLARTLGKDSAVYREFLGGPGHSEEYFDTRYERLAAEFKGKKLEAVIADGRMAFAFMRKYRGVFGHAPVFYCSMERPEPEELAQCGECSGVPMKPDIPGNVALVFALRPQTRLVVGIMDGSPGSRKARQELEAAMEPYLDRAQLIFPGFEPGDDHGLTLETLASVASSVPGAGAVIFLGFSENGDGRGLDESEAVRLLATRSAGPVFVLNDGWIGTGVVGGRVARGAEHGKKVGELVRRLEAGEPVREMLAQPPAETVVLDGTALARFGMGEWPEAAVLVNEPARPKGREGVLPTGPAAWIAGLVLLALCVVLIRRFTGR